FLFHLRNIGYTSNLPGHWPWQRRRDSVGGGPRSSSDDYSVDSHFCLPGSDAHPCSSDDSTKVMACLTLKMMSARINMIRVITRLIVTVMAPGKRRDRQKRLALLLEIGKKMMIHHLNSSCFLLHNLVLNF
ncbi:hypothetical protein LINPERHAP1_LOCUS18667, partial [Linum perenne]